MKKRLCILLCVCLLLTLVSCGGGQTESEETKEGSESMENGNIARSCPYFYDTGVAIAGDPAASRLTDGKKDGEPVALTRSLDNDGKGYALTFKDWNGAERIEYLKNDCAAIRLDLGFLTEVHSFAVTFAQYSGKPCEVFYSTDGYNDSFYVGKMGEYADGVLKADLSVNAKSLLFVFPIDVDEEIRIAEIEVFGNRSAEKVLLSKGATYSFDGRKSTQYRDDDNTKLTDGVFYDGTGEDAIAVISGKTEDEITGKTGGVLDIDLGEKKNVSEVYIKAYRPTKGVLVLPDKICVRYSEDGKTWHDLGQSFLRSTDGQNGSCGNVYCVTRNHTVEARYLKVFTYTNAFLTDEVCVYGAKEPVAEPDYGFVNRKALYSDTDVIAFGKAVFNGTECPELTDRTFTAAKPCIGGRNVIEAEPASDCGAVCGIALTGKKLSAKGLSVKVDGKNVTNMTTYISEVGSETTVYAYFDAVGGKKVSVAFDGNAAQSVTELAVFDGQPQLPLVRGGFFQMPTGGSGGDAASENSDYAWYLMLKGMKDLGMDYVVMQYSAHFTAKTTLVNGKNITGAGFTYVGGYGAADVYEAVLSAADKLGMQVFLGTMHDSDFNDPIGNKPTYHALVEAAKPVIRDLYEMYGKHRSFAGYYLSDEECDQWLNMNGGVEAGRIVYKGQSDYIREIAPDKKIMIAPAIWRSGDPVKGADNLYKLIASDKDGGKPVVDIVAAQDCLGRTSALTVDTATYDSYNTYCAEWAKAVRRAGAEFWHDAEVFEQISTTKRYSELVKTLGTEAKLSGAIVVFDIPHYFTTAPVSPVDNARQYYKTRIMRDYVRYYAGFVSLDRVGTDAKAPKVETNDGKTVEKVVDDPGTDPVTHDERYHDGFLAKKTVTIDDLETLNYAAFQTGNTAGKPEFSLCFDDANLYIAVRTNDQTESFGKGQWWEGKDDLVQIWMTADGNTVTDVSASGFGVRYYLHRQQNGWASGGEFGEKITGGKFAYAGKDGYVLVTIPFAALGIKVPQSGGGAAIGVKIQYIDGADGSWASTNGSNDRSVAATALFSY